MRGQLVPCRAFGASLDVGMVSPTPRSPPGFPHWGVVLRWTETAAAGARSFSLVACPHQAWQVADPSSCPAAISPGGRQSGAADSADGYLISLRKRLTSTKRLRFSHANARAWNLRKFLAPSEFRSDRSVSCGHTAGPRERVRTRRGPGDVAACGLGVGVPGDLAAVSRGPPWSGRSELRRGRPSSRGAADLRKPYNAY